MNRTNSVIATPGPSGSNFEYMTTDGTYIYATYNDATTTTRVMRCNYDGTNVIHINIFNTTIGTISSARGILVIGDIIWLVARSGTNSYLIGCTTSEWADNSTPTSYICQELSNANGGHGLACDSTQRYLYVTAENSNEFNIYDTNTTGLTAYSTYSQTHSICRRTDYYYYTSDVGIYDGNFTVWEYVLSDAITLSYMNPITVGFQPWQVVYDNIDDLYFIGDWNNQSVVVMSPTYAGENLSSLTELEGASGILIPSSDNVVALTGYDKVYPDENTYFDVFASAVTESANLEVIYNNVTGALSGDPQIRTLSGYIYTVPDYLKEFDYLVLTEHNIPLLKITCTTKRITPQDLRLVLDPEQLEQVHTYIDTLCPHTYMDTLAITQGKETLYVNMDTLAIGGIKGNEQLSCTRSRSAMPLTSKPGYHPLTENTVCLQLHFKLGVTMQLWSDMTCIDRHYISTSVIPKDHLKLSGAIVEVPCHKFGARRRNIDKDTPTHHTHTSCTFGDTISILINGVTIKYTCQNIPPYLMQYLRTHELFMT